MKIVDVTKMNKNLNFIECRNCKSKELDENERNLKFPSVK